MTVNGIMGRSTSSRRDKLCEEEVSVDLYALLNVKPKNWFDRRASEDYARELTTGVKEEVVEVIKRIPGLIAEDVEAAGLGQYVLYSSEERLRGYLPTCGLC